MKTRVIIKRTDEKYGHVTNISTSLENLRRTVGGYIETVPAVLDAIILCNENGKLLNLEPNMWYFHDRLCGTIIVIGTKDDEFADCPLTLDTWKKFVDMQEEWGPGYV